MTQTGLVCDSCGAQAHSTAKFCSECGTRLAQATEHEGHLARAEAMP
ncbi:MAG: zinc-ribbon domain [Mycobacterium sp.]|jgi:predicted amidophosphoribosyltransferase|nr:zinc-ribbon domain [Mycobacterium sp.]